MYYRFTDDLLIVYSVTKQYDRPVTALAKFLTCTEQIRKDRYRDDADFIVHLFCVRHPNR